jgi:hypothetical protein
MYKDNDINEPCAFDKKPPQSAVGSAGMQPRAIAAYKRDIDVV